jgi:hypothetical protein
MLDCVAVKFSRLTWEECGPYPVYALCVLYLGIWFTTEEKSTEETLIRVVEKCQLGTIQCVSMAAFCG